MGKIILSERQYSRLKNIIIESALEQTLVNEQKETYTLKVDEFLQTRDGKFKVIGGTEYKPTIKGNLSTQTEVEDLVSGQRKKTKVTFVCSSNKLYIDNKFYDIYRDKNQTKLEELCKKIKTMKKDAYGAESVGGGSSYTQKNNYKLKSKDGKTIEIPKGTGYSAKPDKNGAAFKIGPTIYGWFGCESNVFIIDKVKYKDESGVLAKNISSVLCKKTTKPEVKTDKSVTPVSTTVQPKLAQVDDVLTDFQNYV